LPILRNQIGKMTTKIESAIRPDSRLRRKEGYMDSSPYRQNCSAIIQRDASIGSCEDNYADQTFSRKMAEETKMRSFFTLTRGGT